MGTVVEQPRVKEHTNILTASEGFWPCEAALCFSEEFGFDFCGLMT